MKPVSVKLRGEAKEDWVQFVGELSAAVAREVATDMITYIVPAIMEEIFKRYQPAQPAITVNLPPMQTSVSLPAMSPAFSVVVPETEDEIEIVERNIDGSMRKATKTTRHKK